VPETRITKILHSDGTIEQGEAQIISTVPGEILFSGAGMVRSPFQGNDLFDAFLSLRQKLEEMNFRLLCAGSRHNVWPSGMSRSMGGGRKAYPRTLPG